MTINVVFPIFLTVADVEFLILYFVLVDAFWQAFKLKGSLLVHQRVIHQANNLRHV
jgi:hypothetical protein